MSVVLFKRKLTNFLPCEQNSLRSCKRNEEEKTRELSRKIDWNRICSRGTNLFRQRKVEFSAQLYARPSKINAVHKSNIICGNIDASNADIDNPTKKKKKKIIRGPKKFWKPRWHIGRWKRHICRHSTLLKIFKFVKVLSVVFVLFKCKFTNSLYRQRKLEFRAQISALPLRKVHQIKARLCHHTYMYTIAK